jgi:acetamidase/formamidase
VWQLDAQSTQYNARIRIPLDPFCGVMGVALAEPGAFSTIPPRQNGGNMDIKHITRGSTLLLPVGVDGGLLSVGDCHAAQGDGEVCGTAIEAPMTVTVRVTVLHDATIQEPQLRTPGRLEHEISAGGYHVTTGFSPDLLEASKKALRYMLTHIVNVTGLSPMEAYILSSVAVDLKISEIVNQNYIVSAYLPRSIFV